MFSFKGNYVSFIEKQPREVIQMWVEVAYENYDNFPGAFSFIIFADATKFLRDKYLKNNFDCENHQHFLIHPVADSVKNLIQELRSRQSFEKNLDLNTAIMCFSSILLSIPREIENHRVEGPAGVYSKQVSAAICNLLQIK